MSNLTAFLASTYSTHLATLVAIYVMLAQSLNLTLGLGKFFNLAHIASCAVGAYTTALLSTKLQAHFFICVTSSTLLSGLLALALGGIAFRLSAEYFSIGTLAFTSLISALLVNWRGLTRGVLGIPDIPRPELWGIDFYNNRYFLLLVLIAAAVSQLFFYLLIHSSFGRTLRALAEYEDAVSALGKNPHLIRTLAFFVSSCGAGLAGSFFAYYLRYIDPSSFSLGEMIFVLTIVIVGRPGSFIGVITATIFLVLLPEPLRFLKLDSSSLGNMRQLLQAVILFLVVWWKRATLFPQQRQV